jgi:small subunit ribosomal protein S2
MAFPTIQNLLESGVHFGHQTRRWNPKMKKFIFAERNGIHIIDLKKTLNHLKKASDKVREIAEKGGNILFVGTKKQLRDIIRDEAVRCGMYYVNERWLGGMITNFQTIKKNIRRLRELERMRDEGEFELRTKKEALSLQRELLKLQKTLDGIKLLGDIPDAMFVVDTQKEKIAVAEANKLKIPLIALIDTNADPEQISYPVAGNDDAIRSVKMITQTIADAVLEGKAKMVERIEGEKEKEVELEAARVEMPAKKEWEQPKRARPRRRQRKKRPVEELAAREAREKGERRKAEPDGREKKKAEAGPKRPFRAPRKPGAEIKKSEERKARKPEEKKAGETEKAAAEKKAEDRGAKPAGEEKKKAARRGKPESRARKRSAGKAKKAAGSEEKKVVAKDKKSD